MFSIGGIGDKAGTFPSVGPGSSNFKARQENAALQLGYNISSLMVGIMSNLVFCYMPT